MKLRVDPAMKALAFVAAVAAFAATAIMGWYQLANYDALWNPNYNVGDGYSIYYLERMDYDDINYLLSLTEAQQEGRDLSLYEEQELARLESELSAENTNLRWQLRGTDKQVIQGNTQEALPVRALGLLWTTYEATQSSGVSAEHIAGVAWGRIAGDAVNGDDLSNAIYTDDWQEQLEYYWNQYQSDTADTGAAETADGWEEDTTTVSGAPEEWSLDGVDLDTVFLAADGTAPMLLITDESGELYAYAPCLRWVLQANEFGYQYMMESLTWEQTQYTPEILELVMWLDEAFPVDDQYKAAYDSLDQWKQDRELLLALTIVCAVTGILLTAYLCAAAGHKRGQEGIVLNWFHKIPADVLAVLLFFGVILAIDLVAQVTMYYAYTDLSMAGQLVLVGLLVAAAAAMCLGGLLTVVARCKAHTLWRNTLIWRFCRWLWRMCRAVVEAFPLTWKVVLVGVGYMLFTIFTFNYYGGSWLLGTAVCIVLLCLWAFQWKKIRTGAQQIIGGNPEYHIDTRHMLPDLKQHADELNNLGQAISAAVEDRMKSEHFKAELITNVSHDLKTPLTSIINYVDLLKKVPIDDPKAQEYIEVLDRKSQRLKKLTEDLVEASKASTGNLTVALEPLDLTQLAQQALAEYEDRLEGKGLAVVTTFPEGALWVEADGRHLWRVIDNLLSNCAKYALEGTRIYLEVRRTGESAVLSIKNISRDALNVPPEMLMERFVRGDESRTTEGSGLGLSIAQSLTELQKGRFALEIDGDLFKATVTLPLAPRPPVGGEELDGLLSGLEDMLPPQDL